MFDQLSRKMTARSAALLLTIDNRIHGILKSWLLIAGFLSAARIAVSPHPAGGAGLTNFISYMLLVVAPFASTLLALRWFREGHRQPQPTIRLARAGRWKALTRFEAEQHPLFGPTGILVSLLVGMMLNVPVRALEYMAAMPPIPEAAPAWLSALHFASRFLNFFWIRVWQFLQNREMPDRLVKLEIPARLHCFRAHFTETLQII